MAIKIGNIDVSYFKVGSSDCTIYLGDTLLYPTTLSYKFQATYSGGQTYSEQCDSSTELTSASTKPSGYVASAMTTAVVGDCVTNIGDRSFRACTSLSSITIPNSVTSIGESVFRDCSSLTSITIPSGVTRISVYAFQGCTSLTSIDIPSGITRIGVQAFMDCSGLSSITVNATTPPTLGSYAFNSTNNCPIYVPSGSVNAYKAASGWSDLASRIQAIQ